MSQRRVSRFVHPRAWLLVAVVVTAALIKLSPPTADGATHMPQSADSVGTSRDRTLQSG